MVRKVTSRKKKKKNEETSRIMFKCISIFEENEEMAPRKKTKES